MFWGEGGGTITLWRPHPLVFFPIRPSPLFCNTSQRRTFMARFAFATLITWVFFSLGWGWVGGWVLHPLDGLRTILLYSIEMHASAYRSVKPDTIAQASCGQGGIEGQTQGRAGGRG